MGRRTVGRVITEAGVKVSICLSSDGTSNRNIKYEARHITYKSPTYTTDPNAPQEVFSTRLVEVDHALDHTAQTQYEGWDVANDKIIDTYINSPLARRDALEGVSYEADDLWRKTVAYSADHASDVRLAAHKVKDRKQLVVESDLGRQEIENALWDVLQEMSVAPYPAAVRNNSPPPEFGTDWNVMEANNEGNLSLSADQQAVASLSQAILERFDDLPMSDDEFDEHSDEEPELPNEPEVSAIPEPGAEAEEAHSRKRARMKDPVTTSRFWYPWPDCIEQ
ncbi:hypothetical protein B0H13DRAFT_2312862 [Mycena leptocephala]|nr:hypothetical protein B0H13DRAFT_2312862 [Mycena leptocephala]